MVPLRLLGPLLRLSRVLLLGMLLGMLLLRWAALLILPLGRLFLSEGWGRSQESKRERRGAVEDGHEVTFRITNRSTIEMARPFRLSVAFAAPSGVDTVHIEDDASISKCSSRKDWALVPSDDVGVNGGDHGVTRSICSIPAPHFSPRKTVRNRRRASSSGTPWLSISSASRSQSRISV